MTGCAVYFSLARQFLPRTPDNLGQILVLSGIALYTGLCWTGALMAVWQMLGKDSRLLEPGTWLLFSLGCILAIDLGVGFLPSSLAVRAESLQVGGTCLALAMPTLSRRLPASWKVWFAVMALLMAGKLVWLLVSLTRQIAMPERLVDGYALLRSVVGLILLGAVIVRDRQLARHYGWLHGMGVACAVIWLALLLQRA